MCATLRSHSLVQLLLSRCHLAGVGRWQGQFCSEFRTDRYSFVFALVFIRLWNVVKINTLRTMLDTYLVKALLPSSFPSQLIRNTVPYRTHFVWHQQERLPWQRDRKGSRHAIIIIIKISEWVYLCCCSNWQKPSPSLNLNKMVISWSL